MATRTPARPRRKRSGNGVLPFSSPGQVSGNHMVAVFARTYRRGLGRLEPGTSRDGVAGGLIAGGGTVAGRTP